jgi:uncharacterized protein DUF6186
MGRAKGSNGSKMHLVAVVGWIVVFTALFVWQGFALVFAPRWPTFSDLVRPFMRPAIGRVALFALWLWVGWHLFIRGWQFFLRGRL